MHYIIHHDDPDGHVAGAIIYDYLINTKHVPADAISTFPADYNSDIPSMIIDNLVDEIYLLDLSFTPGTAVTLEKLVNRYKNTKIYWMDHHASSQPVANGAIASLRGKIFMQFSTNICGAIHAFLFTKNNGNVLGNNFTAGYDDEDNYDDEDYDDVYELDGYYPIDVRTPKFIKTFRIPAFLYHLDNYDRWTKEDPNADAFICGLKATKYSYYLSPLNTENEDGLYRAISRTFSTTYTNTIVDMGAIAYKYHMAIMNEQLDSVGYWTVGNVKIAYKNGIGNSWNFGNLLEDNLVDMALLGHYDPEHHCWNYSMYSNKNISIPVNRICEHFGGGGHPGAAGFSSNICFFDEDYAFDSKWFAKTYVGLYVEMNKFKGESDRDKRDPNKRKTAVYIGGTPDNSWRQSIYKLFNKDFYYDPTISSNYEHPRNFKYRIYVFSHTDAITDGYCCKFDIALKEYFFDPDNTMIVFCREGWNVISDDKFDINEIIEEFKKSVDKNHLIVTDDKLSMIHELGGYFANIVRNIK